MDYTNTFCNPIPLPDYPQGRSSKNPSADGWGWFDGIVKSFRETADPSVIYEDNKWYLYPSCGMVWVSEDFRTWKHVEMNISDVGYAPTVVKHKNKFYLTACDAPVYVSDSPAGPWKKGGMIMTVEGKPLPAYIDPMLFSDDDERLYCYWGCGGDGIYGVELDADFPEKAVTKEKILFSYNPSHKWENYGPFNEDPSHSWVEGPWMFKHNGRYYLTYAAPCTEFSSYSMGCYTADSPLGPFSYQKRNPILSTRSGLVNGPGHGCIVRGPNDTVWAFYTCTACRNHIFERRTGFDPVGFDENGEIFVNGANQCPQWAPGVRKSPAKDNSTGMFPVSVLKFSRATSQLPGRTTSCAIDNTMRTWWEAAPDDKQPVFELDLRSLFDISAVRVIWAEPNLDYKTNKPGPYSFVIESKAELKDEWRTIVDASDEKEDMLIDYRTFETHPARYIRLKIFSAPENMAIGLTDFTVFGNGRMPDNSKVQYIPLE